MPKFRVGKGLLRAILFGVMVLHFGCTTLDVTETAREFELTSAIVDGGLFKHRVFQKSAKDKLLHVYIEGDGRAWLTPRRIALDPTPRKPLLLKLMSLDSAPGIYVGRPCYFDVPDDSCEPKWWTSHRYAPEVVNSLNGVIDQYVGSFSGIVMIGHSGGGALAMLVAAKRSDVRAVVTLAGNLDIRAWTRYHQISELTGSLNPAEQAPLDRSIVQRHYLGSLDKRVTKDLIQPTVVKQPNAELIMLEGFDHNCCWEGFWAKVLADLEGLLHPHPNPLP